MNLKKNILKSYCLKDASAITRFGYQVKSPRYPIAPTYINQILYNCRSNRPEVRVTSPRQIKNSTVEIGCKIYGFHDSDCHVSAKFKFKDENVQNAIIN